MSIPDDVIYKYFVLATKVKDLAEIKATLDAGTENPRNIKVRLAQEIIKQFHDETAASAALERFELMFVKKEVPDDIPEVSIGSEPRSIVDMIVEHKLAASKSDARRLIQGSGVSLDGEKVVDEKATVTPTAEGVVLKVGKRKFLKIKL
jgi:tyrosyl-tRNA synthetase